MTTTPAPTDLDFDPACSCRRCGKCDRALGELAKLRDRLTEAEAVIINAQDALTTDHPVFWILDDYDGSMDSVQTLKRERDAAREELAKTRAELAATHTELERLRGVIREGVDMAEWHRNEVTTWKRKAAKLREQLGSTKARISAAATVEVWTNEDGKRFVFADDLMAALDPNPEANPATTAEPADEPKADASTWPECGRGVHGDWCRRPVNHDGDCSPKSRRLAKLRTDAEPVAG
jgi:hypothetical protein